MNSIESWTYKPQKLDDLLNDTKALGFNMVSEPKVGMLLRFLAASKQNGQFLELGTGTGYGTAWILDGMDKAATLECILCSKPTLNCSIFLRNQKIANKPVHIKNTCTAGYLCSFEKT